MDVVTIEKNSEIPLRTLFEETVKKSSKVTFGTVVIPPGKRVPLEGMSAHKENEYSVVIKGAVITESGEDKIRMSSGQVGFIPADESHSAYNNGDEDCEIVWVLVG